MSSSAGSSARTSATWAPSCTRLLAPPNAETPRAGAPLSYADILLRFGYAAAARAFARKYAAFPQETVVANLVRRIEEIIAPSRPTDALQEKP